MTPDKMIERTKELAERVRGWLPPALPPTEGGLQGATGPVDGKVLALIDLLEVVESLASMIGLVDGNHFRLAMRIQAIEEERGSSPEAGHRRALQKAFGLLATVEAQLPQKASARRAIKRARRELEKAIGKLAAEGETEAGKVLGEERERRKKEREERRSAKGKGKKSDDEDEDEFEEDDEGDGDFDDADLAASGDGDDEEDDDDLGDEEDDEEDDPLDVSKVPVGP